MPAPWPKYDVAECSAFRRIISSRRLSTFQFLHIGEFHTLLKDRQLMSSFIHVSACLNPACRRANGRVQRWLMSNPEIPVAIIAAMEAWRTKLEGWLPAPKRRTR